MASAGLFLMAAKGGQGNGSAFYLSAEGQLARAAGRRDGNGVLARLDDALKGGFALAGSRKAIASFPCKTDVQCAAGAVVDAQPGQFGRGKVNHQAGV